MRASGHTPTPRISVCPRGAVLLGLAGAFLAAGAGTARAQATTTAPEDSLGRKIFGFLRPTYTTSYNITDQESSWDQTFKFQNTFGLFNLESNTGYNVKTDPNRTNFRATAGQTDNRLRYNLFDRIPLTASLVYNRDGTDDTNDRNRRSTTNSGLDGSYKWRVRRGMDVNVQGGIGLNSRREHAVGIDTETDVRENGHDFTLGGGYSWLNMIPGMSVSLNTDRNISSVRTETLDGDTLSQPSDAKTNTRASLVGSWTYLPFEAFETKLTVDRKTLTDNFIIVSRDTTLNGRQESQENLTQTITLNTTIRKPATVVTDEFNVTLSSTANTNDRAIEKERAVDRSGRSLSIKGKKFQFGTQFDTRFDVARDEDRSPLRPTLVTDSRTLEQKLNRTFNPNLSVYAVGEASLRTQKYTDPTNDQDIQKLRAETTVSWRSGGKYTATFGGRANATDFVNVNGATSASSRNEQNYGGSANLSWTVSRRTKVTQNYDYRLALTTFRFNSANDVIQRTRDIRTTISYDFILAPPNVGYPSVRLDMNHTYRLSQFGKYRFVNGARFFARTNDRYDQDLALGLAWTINDWLSLRTDEVFHRDDAVVRTTRDRRINRRLELLQTAKISRPLPGSGTIDCTVTYRARQLSSESRTTRGNTETSQPEEDFLNVNLMLTKPF
jgi:hypothetical protein